MQEKIKNFPLTVFKKGLPFTCTIANAKFISIFKSVACMNEMMNFLALASADIRREDLLTLKVSFL